jgi:hypothetical protein
VVAGQQYCFLIQNGVIVGILSGIPTAVQLPSHHGLRQAQARAE